MSTLTGDDLYQRLHVGNDGDLRFYKGVTRGAKRVLEMGSGWGRLAIPLSRQGCQVTGVDLNSEFIKIARSRAPEIEFIEADVTRLELPGTFERVIIPYNTLYSLGGEEGIRACIQAARRLIDPDGELWFDVYPIDELHEALENGDEVPDDDEELVTTFELNGVATGIYERTLFAPKDRRLDVTYRALQEDNEKGRLEMTHHYLPSQELVSLVCEEGFEISGYFESFSGETTEEGPEQHILGAVLTGQ